MNSKHSINTSNLSLVFNTRHAEELLNSNEEFPISFDKAWKWLGFARKDTAKRNLKDCGFVKNYDYRVTNNEQSKGRPEELIYLTVDCFKCWCMMSRTTKGKKIRLYFLECERELQTKNLVSQVLHVEPVKPIPPEQKVSYYHQIIQDLVFLNGNPEAIDSRTRQLLNISLKNTLREIERLSLDNEDQLYSLTEIASMVFKVNLDPGPQKGGAAYIGKRLINVWRKKYGHPKEVKPPTCKKYLNRLSDGTAYSGHEVEIYTYPPEDWHLIGELLIHYGYKIDEGSEKYLTEIYD
jgi:phage anti-repressor protein